MWPTRMSPLVEDQAAVWLRYWSYAYDTSDLQNSTITQRLTILWQALLQSHFLMQ